MCKVSIWVDDIRPMPKNFERHCINYDSAIATIEYFSLCEDGIEKLSLDHDLGEEKTGYDIAKWIVEHQPFIDCIYLHTANPVGRYNMYQLLTHYGYNVV